MSIKSLTRRFLAWIGCPVALPRMPVTTKPTSMHEAELMLTALAQLRTVIEAGTGRYMCTNLAFLSGDLSLTGVTLQLRDDIRRALGARARAEQLIWEWFWYEPSWSDSELYELAKQVRLRWIAETTDAVVDYMLEQTAPNQPLMAPPATAQE